MGLEVNGKRFSIVLTCSAYVVPVHTWNIKTLLSLIEMISQDPKKSERFDIVLPSGRRFTENNAFCDKNPAGVNTLSINVFSRFLGFNYIPPLYRPLHNRILYI